ncbi:hypothetical protein ES703_85422 [subsurface metagenome]
MKKKKVYNSKTIRISLGDYALLDELSRQARITFGEALHQLITQQAKRQAIVVPKSQIPMPAFQVSAQPTFRVRSQPTVAIDGNKAGVFVIKPKGGVIRD